jgi:hypothetical protein
MSKSHVSLEQAICPATGKVFTPKNAAIFLDKRLKASMEERTITHYEICPEVQEKIDEGYIVLVGVDMEKSKQPEPGSSVNAADVYRTGEIVYLKREVFMALFDVKSPHSMSYTPQETLDMLKQQAGDHITDLDAQ